MDARFPRRGSPCAVGAFSLTYDRFHDMRGIPGIMTAATAADVVADWGWQQDKSASMTIDGTTYTGSKSFCFYANTPNGSQWKARGVVWARAAGRSSSNRLPLMGPLVQLNLSDSMAYPVLWIVNTSPENDPHIRSPKLENGVGTISFNVRNFEGESKIKLQLAYTEGEPDVLDWNDLQEYAISGSRANFNITNVVNDTQVTYVRILRSERYGSYPQVTVDSGWIGIDNICLTPPGVCGRTKLARAQSVVVSVAGRRGDTGYTAVGGFELLDRNGSIYRFPQGTQVSQTNSNVSVVSSADHLIDGRADTQVRTYCSQYYGYKTPTFDITLPAGHYIDLNRYTRWRWTTGMGDVGEDPTKIAVAFSFPSPYNSQNAGGWEGTPTESRGAVAATCDIPPFYFPLGHVVEPDCFAIKPY